MIFRDDDIRADSDPVVVAKIHQIFVKYDRVHTLGLQLENLYRTPIWNWMVETYKNTPEYLHFELHCWTHRFYYNLPYEEVVADLQRCIDYWNLYRGEMPAFKMFFPPNSLTSPTLYRACEKVGLVCVNLGENYPSHVIHWGDVKDGSTKFEEIEKMLETEKSLGH